jgi:hypothetical protein
MMIKSKSLVIFEHILAKNQLEGANALAYFVTSPVSQNKV